MMRRMSTFGLQNLKFKNQCKQYLHKVKHKSSDLPVCDRTSTHESTLASRWVTVPLQGEMISCVIFCAHITHVLLCSTAAVMVVFAGVDSSVIKLPCSVQ